jgi:hypothetical protein
MTDARWQKEVQWRTILLFDTQLFHFVSCIFLSSSMGDTKSVRMEKRVKEAGETFNKDVNSSNVTCFA